MSIEIRINGRTSTPKYEQLVNEVLRNIKAGELNLGDKLPSIHGICGQYDISRDTVITAYNELKSRGIISPRHGKGFYVSSLSVRNKLKIFMLFDVMNSYKEVLYRSLVDNLGKGYEVDIFFHYYNIEVFSRLIDDHIGKYGFYIIMPHFNKDVSEMIRPIPKNKLLIIDKDVLSPIGNYAAVYQDFENDIYNTLDEAMPYLKKFSGIKFISNREFQFIPDGMRRGFNRFCRSRKLRHKQYRNIPSASPARGDVFLVVSDQDLVEILKIARKNKWKLGKDIGVISYDDTPLKEILAGGISVISTDFRQMGKTAADLVKQISFTRIGNPCYFIARSSL